MRVFRTTVVLGALLACMALIPASAATIYSFPFDVTPGEGGPGWTMSGGNWQYGEPQGLGGGTSFDPASAYSGDYVYGYDLTYDGLYENNINPSGYLRTTALDCRGFKNVTLRFQRWLGVESSTFDHARVMVSNNGSAWTTVWENSTSSFTDSAWTQVTYDISAVADGQETVYVQWTMGPTDSIVTYCGWNIDDVEILGDPATEILAWIPYTDMTPGQEYDKTFTALDSLYTAYNVTQSIATDASTLSDELEGKHVFLALEQELTDTSTLESLGAEFEDLLWNFVDAGGTVIVCGEFDFSGYQWEGFLNATDLMEVDAVTDCYYYSDEPMTVVESAHPLATGLGATIISADATVGYEVGSEATPIVEDDSGNAIVAVRQLGPGAVILLGFDFWSYSADIAQILANAVQYPRAFKQILLYDNNDPEMHVAKEALNRLNYPFTICNDDTLDTNLGAQSWDLVVIDCPNWKPTFGWTDFISYVDGGGHAILSTWALTSETDLCAAFDATAVEDVDTPATIYDWDAGPPLFDFHQTLPTTLSGWLDYWISTRTRLSPTGDGIALAGFAASPTADQAAIVCGNDYRTFLNGFLYDDRFQDDDSDGVQDVVELLMNQIQMLLTVPYVDFSADPTACVVGDTVSFTNETDAAVTTVEWQFGDGGTSTAWEPTHSYSSAGIYGVTLTATNNNGSDRDTRERYIWVGFPDTPTDFWAFEQILECVDAEVVQGYPEGIYGPTITVNRAQMATYIARALAGGDADVPAGPSTASFTDVGTDHWAFKYIEYAVSENVVTGYPEGDYKPDLELDRGQMAVFVARAVAGDDSCVPDGPVTPTFPDVPDDYWSYKHIEYCVDQSIVSGYLEGDYRPENPVTRDQMAVYVSRALPLL